MAKPTSPPPEQSSTADLPAQQLLEWLKRNQVTIAWTVGIVFLGLVLIFGFARYHQRNEDNAWTQLARTNGVEPLRNLVQEFGSTSAGPHLRWALARALLDAETQVDRSPTGEADFHERKLGQLREAIVLYAELQGEWTEPPLAALVNHMHLKANEELQWEQKFGKQYTARTVTPKHGKSLGELVAKPDRPEVVIETSKGAIVCELFEDETKNSVANFLALAAEGFYDGLDFHRVGPRKPSSPQAQDGVPPVVQGGKPQDVGGPGYSIRSELVASIEFEVGTLCWANSGRNTAGSQFYICKEKIEDQLAQSWKQSYTRFGKVKSGMEVVAKLVQGDIIKEIRILKRRGTKDDFPYRPVVLAIPEGTVEAPPDGGAKKPAGAGGTTPPGAGGSKAPGAGGSKVPGGQ